MGKLHTHINPLFTVSVRFKNPWRKGRPRRILPDSERCEATTQAGTRCLNSKYWSGGDYCSHHRPPRPVQPETQEVTNEGTLPEDPAEWLASLGDAT